ncbi:hypothetical protein AB1Y20_021970 [Prymnesium parvum]|uniref:J domain-containing protein n=1 Tax=Prymnesium parvum TaxID=97485 RepID=A0AB34JFQ8_PRYPA
MPLEALGLHVKASRGGSLDLTCRRLASVPPELAPLAPSLHRLDLSHNHLASLDLPDLPSLAELHLVENALDSRAVQLAPLPRSMRVLDLSHNRLSAFPPQLLRLSQLHVLRLAGQRLAMLPEALCLLPQLIELDASHNAITTALPLAAPGLPCLRRLLLRANTLRDVALDAERLPCLTELDLAANSLAAFPSCLAALVSLRTLSLAHNRLRALVSSSLAPRRRLWVPSEGFHSLTQLCHLSLAQNELTELPLGLRELRQLTSLDLRCNPLSASSLALASSHCQQVGATLRATSVRRLLPGLSLGDESSAWHRPSLRHAKATHLVSISLPPPSGVPLARLLAHLPEESSLLRLADVVSPRAEVSADAARRAFHAQALQCHPDKQPHELRDAAAGRFARLQEAYRTVCRWMHIERRKLPEFSAIHYHFVDLTPNMEGAEAGVARPSATEASSTGGSGADGSPAKSFLEAAAVRASDAMAGRGGEEVGATVDTGIPLPLPPTPPQEEGVAMSTPAAQALAVALEAQLSSTLQFIREARASDGEVLLHAGASPPGVSHAAATFIALAVMISSCADSYTAATRRLHEALGHTPQPLPPPLVDALHAFDTHCLRERVRLAREEPAAAQLNAPASLSDEVRSAAVDTVVTRQEGQAGPTEEEALAQGWTVGRVGRFEVLFAPDSRMETEAGERQTFVG